MPRRELSRPQQIIDWLVEWGNVLEAPASMTLIGSAALLWHATDILVPKLKRNEPRDRAHAAWAKELGIA